MSREGAAAGDRTTSLDESGDRPASPETGPGARLIAMRRASRRRRRRHAARSGPQPASLLLAISLASSDACAGARDGENPHAFPLRPVLAAACALGLPCARARAGLADATDLDEVIVTATRTAITVDDALRRSRGDRRRRDRTQPGALAARAAARPRRRQPGQPGRPGQADHAVPARRRIRPCAGAGRRHPHRLGDFRPGRVPGPADRPDRPRRDRARPALEPVRFGRDRRRDPDLHPARRRRHFAPRVRVGVGSNDTREAGAGFGVGNDARPGSVRTPAYQRTDGINACDGFFDPITFAGAGCFIAPDSQPDRDGYRNAPLSLRGGSNVERCAEPRRHTPCAPRPRTSSTATSSTAPRPCSRWSAASCVTTRTDASTLQLTAGRNRDASDNFLGDAFTGLLRHPPRQRHAAGRHRPHRRPAAHASAPTGCATGSTATLRSIARRRDNRAAFVQYQGELTDTHGAHCRPACAATTTTSSAATPPAAPRGAWRSGAAGASPPATAPRSRRRRSTNCTSRSSAIPTCVRKRRTASNSACASATTPGAGASTPTKPTSTT